MPKSIHERVRDKLEKAARDTKKKSDRAHDAKWNRAEKRALADEAKLIECEDYGPSELDIIEADEFRELSADW